MSIDKYTRTIEGIEYVKWDYHKNVTGHINDALRKCIKEHDELKAEVQELPSWEEFRNLQEKFQYLSTQNLELMNKVSDLEVCRKKLTEMYLETNQACIDTEKGLLQRDDELLRVEVERDELKAKLEKAEADFKNIEQTKNAWQDRAKNLEAKVQDLEVQLASKGIGSDVDQILKRGRLVLEREDLKDFLDWVEKKQEWNIPWQTMFKVFKSKQQQGGGV